MATIPLHEFIGTYRNELIQRCTDRATARSSPPRTVDVDHGVPLILEQLVRELRSDDHTETNEIIRGAADHGHDLLLEGFSISDVVHNYGDVCQAVTDLAVELNAPIDTEDFRTMNRCLDDAIASAVTEHGRGQGMARDGESDELRNLVDTAITAFGVLRSGSVGIKGKTADVLERSLAALRVFAGRQSAAAAKPVGTPATPTDASHS